MSMENEGRITGYVGAKMSHFNVGSNNQRSVFTVFVNLFKGYDDQGKPIEKPVPMSVVAFGPMSKYVRATEIAKGDEVSICGYTDFYDKNGNRYCNLVMEEMSVVSRKAERDAARANRNTGNQAPANQNQQPAQANHDQSAVDYSQYPEAA